MRVLFVAILLMGLLSGCGALPAVVGSVQAVTQAGYAQVAFGVGGIGGAQPALLQRQDGSWVVVFVGTRSGARQLYSAVSQDGRYWTEPRRLGQSGLSDQAPVFIEDTSGTLHLYLASNRDGDQYELYHATWPKGATWWDGARMVAGFGGIQDLALTRRAGRFWLLAEIMGEGLVVASSGDGETFGAVTQVAEAGFEPSLCAVGETGLLAVYHRAGVLYRREMGVKGQWLPEERWLESNSRLREPVVSWSESEGLLAFIERTGSEDRLRVRRFGEDRRLEVAVEPSFLGGGGRSPVIFRAQNGKMAWAWGMKTVDGRQGVTVCVPQDLM
jgi:hypothetical protein